MAEFVEHGVDPQGRRVRQWNNGVVPVRTFDRPALGKSKIELAKEALSPYAEQAKKLKPEGTGGIAYTDEQTGGFRDWLRKKVTGEQP